MNIRQYSYCVEKPAEYQKCVHCQAGLKPKSCDMLLPKCVNHPKDHEKPNNTLLFWLKVSKFSSKKENH